MKKILILIVMFILTGCSFKASQPNKPVNLTKAAKYNIRLGLGYLQEKQIPRAQEKLLLALKQAPDLPEAQLAMGYFLLAIDEIKRAKRYYVQALRLAPQDGEVQNNYGVYLCRVGQYQEAVNYFVTAAHNVHYLKIAEAYENAGLCALKIPDKIRSQKYFAKALHYGAKRKQSRRELKSLNSK